MTDHWEGAFQGDTAYVAYTGPAYMGARGAPYQASWATKDVSPKAYENNKEWRDTCPG
jgi:hypothetical protein